MNFPPPYINIEYFYNTFNYNDFQALFWDNVRAVQNQWYGVTVNHIECHQFFLDEMFQQTESLASMKDKEPVILFGVPVKTRFGLQVYEINIYFNVPDENKDQS